MKARSQSFWILTKRFKGQSQNVILSGAKNLGSFVFGSTKESCHVSLRYLCELNCACARRRLSAAAFDSGLKCSAASNSGMLSLGFPDARRANPRLAWAGALLGYN